LTGSSERPRRLARLASAAAVAIALGAAAWLTVGGDALRARLEGPEAGARRVLAAAREAPAVPLPGGEGTFRVDRVRFAEPVVRADGARAEVTVVAEGEGTVALRGAEVRVGLVAQERIPMASRPGGGWAIAGPALLPRTTSLLAVLCRRAAAFDDAAPERYGPLVDEGYRGADGGREGLLRRIAADLGALPRARLRPVAWQLRLEREEAEVGEDYEIAAGGPPRRLRARFRLREGSGGWTFTEGL
jgi:hypothetical protein